MPTTRVSTLSVLFADISGSVAMYSELGDATASRVVSEALWLMAEATGQHHGDVIETRGDEVLCTFERPDDAVAAAVAMQRAASEQLPSRNPDTPTGFGLHVGIHHGEVIIEDRQLFGDTVNRAARVRSLAKRGQVLLSAATQGQLSAHVSSQLRFLDEVVLRGQSVPEAVYEYVWQTDATMIGIRPTQLRASRRKTRRSATLSLHFGGKSVEVGATRPSVTLGRGDSVDIMVVDDMASREHARVEQRRGRFVLGDFSTNGTYVEHIGSDAPQRLLHRDEVELIGRGRISLGRELEKAEHVIWFEWDEATEDDDAQPGVRSA